MNNGQYINDHIIIKPKVTTEENIVGINILPVFENKFYLMKVWSIILMTTYYNLQLAL